MDKNPAFATWHYREFVTDLLNIHLKLWGGDFSELIFGGRSYPPIIKDEPGKRFVMVRTPECVIVTQNMGKLSSVNTSWVAEDPENRAITWAISGDTYRAMAKSEVNDLDELVHCVKLLKGSW